MSKLIKTNNNLNLKSIDLDDPIQIENIKFLSDDKIDELRELKAYQRLLRLTDCEDSSLALLKQNIHSVFNITNMARSIFVNDYSKYLHNNKQKAGDIYDKAVAKKSQILNTYVAISQHKSPFYSATRFDNLSQATDQNFNHIPSYEDLFGEVDFCSCPHCRTIFSPAAYFVDLMNMQSKYILQKDDDLSITKRRSDLETIELSCKNTNELVPSISIVNDVLINSIEESSKSYKVLNDAVYPFNLPFNKPLSDINIFLKNNDLSLFKIWEGLNSKAFFKINNNNVYLDILGITQKQWDIFTTDLDSTEELSKYYGYKTNNSNLMNDLTPIDTFLKRTQLTYPELNELLFENLSCTQIANGKIQKHFFINQGTKSLINQGTDQDATNILTTTIQKAFCDNKSIDKEELVNLNETHLSNINRFVRLAKAIGFSFIELDWALRTIEFIMKNKDVDRAILEDYRLKYLAWFKQIKQNNPKLSMEEICSIQGLIKDYGDKDSKSLFDRIFNNSNIPNPPKWYSIDNKGDKQFNQIWDVPSLDSNKQDDSTNQQIQTALMASLKISEVELILIAKQMLKANGIKDNNNLPLTLENLSIFYRFSLLPKILKLSIEEIFTALEFIGKSDADNIIDNIVKCNINLQDLLIWLQEFSSWKEKLSLSTYEIEYLLTGKSQNPKIQNQVIDEEGFKNLEEELKEDLQTTLITKESLEDALGVYSDYNQYTKEAQEYIFDFLEKGETELKNKIESIFPQIYYDSEVKEQRIGYLTKVVTEHKEDTKEIFIKNTKKAFAEAMSSDYLLDTIIEKLNQNNITHISNSFNEIMGALVNNPKIQDSFFEELLFCKSLKDDKHSDIFTLLDTKLQALLAPFLDANFNIQQSVYQNFMLDFLNIEQEIFDQLLKNLNKKENQKLSLEDLQKLQRYAVLISLFNLSPLDLVNITSNPKSYSYTNNTISIDFINSLYNYKSLKIKFEDNQDLFSSLISEKQKDKDKLIEQLSSITQWNPSELKFLINKLYISLPISIDNIALLNNWFTLSQKSNLDITSIYNLYDLSKSDIEYKKLEELSFCVWSGLLKVYESKPKELNNIKASTEVITRDYLAPYVLANIGAKEQFNINNLRDLSNYLLIDIEVGAEVETSIIKSAISTVQLYLYRCLNNLEQGIDVLDNFESWWEWIENYRVWEANRKVFIFPENYIEPELRTDKTPLFSQLEINLQQANLQNPANVESAVNSYLDGFSKVANLSIDSSAGYDYTTYINTGNIKDTHDEKVQESFKNFCFIGKTKEESFKYYYRMAKFIKQKEDYEPVEWGAWQEISIPLQAIGPVKPFFAFGKWFIFWLEQLQTGEDNKTPTHTIYCKCSYLNFNNEWVVPQTIKEIQSNKFYDIDKTSQKDNIDAWNQVYISYMYSLNIMFFTYGVVKDNKAEYQFTYGDEYLRDDLKDSVKYISKELPDTNYQIPYGNQEIVSKYSYWKKELEDESFKDIENKSTLTWLKVDSNDEAFIKVRLFPSGGEYLSLKLFSSSDKKIKCEVYNKDNTLCIARGKSSDSFDLKKWNFLYLNTDNKIKFIPENPIKQLKFKEDALNNLNYNYHIYTNDTTTYITSIISSVDIKDKKLSYNKKKVSSFYISKMQDRDIITNTHEVTIKTPINIVSEIGLFNFDTKLYAFWLSYESFGMSTFNNSLYIGEIENDENNNKIINNYKKVNNISIEEEFSATVNSILLPSIIVGKQKQNNTEVDKIYCAYASIGSYSNKDNYFGYIDLKDENSLTFNSISDLEQTTNSHNTAQPTLFKKDNDIYILYLENQQISSLKFKSYYYNKSSNKYELKDITNGDLKFDNNAQGVLISANVTNANGDLYLNTLTNYSDQNYGYSQRISFKNDKIINPEGKAFLEVNDDDFDSYLDLSLLSTLYLNDKIVSFYNIKEPKEETNCLDSYCPAIVNFFFPKMINNQDLKIEIFGKNANFNQSKTYSIEYYSLSKNYYQEFLVYRNNRDDEHRTKVDNEGKIEEYYNNTKHFITQNYTNRVNNKLSEYFSDKTTINYNTIINEPAWQTFSKNGIEILATFDKDNKMVCYRLNTTANNYLNEKLFLEGINGLLSLNSQYSKELPFNILNPEETKTPKKYWPMDSIDFHNSPMSKYYWEIFFYMPYLIAKSLQTAQQNSAAKAWYEYIFNPTINLTNDDIFGDEYKNDKFWRFVGLRSSQNPTLKNELSKPWSEEIKDDTQNPIQLYAYHNDPFEPHLLAQARPIAYQKNIVMNYIDNLMTWGDKLFREYTVESIVEASMHYITAYDLLGEEPKYLGECPLLKEENLNNFIEKFQNLQNIPEFLIQIERTTPDPKLIFKGADIPATYIPNLYFNLPENEQLIQHWDRVQERLYNIRHGLNIEGVAQKLALFEPAINPAQLVAQIGSGGSLSSAKSFLNSSIPYYRFSSVLQLAKSTTGDVIQFGKSLLSALEKKDAGKLNLLQNQHQLVLLEQTTGTKQAQIDSIEQTVHSLEYSLKGAQDRYEHYTKLIDKGLSTLEESEFLLSDASISTSAMGAGFKGASIGGYGSPTVFGLSNGGMNIGRTIEMGGHIANTTAKILKENAAIVKTSASQERREHEWKFQQKLAKNDKEKITYEIESSKYKLQEAKEQISTHEKNIKQLQEVQQILKSRFTNEQLYQWMVSRLSSLFFQTYQLALDISQQAQQAWNFEKGVERSFIKGNYWDGLYDGLLSGESLMLSLNQMENAYKQENKRRLEIQKSIALTQDNIDALKEQGECMFSFSEETFDKDYPGMYNRQIKSISVTIPNAVGPYENIKATLTQLRNSTVLKPDIKAVKYLYNSEDEEGSNENIRENVLVNQQIAISTGVKDSGLFYLNFNDERYLPFEGTGVVSTWGLVINNDDILDNISEIIIQINYTALQGSLAFEKEVRDFYIK